MAMVRKLVLQELETESRHQETECTYTVVEARNGPYLQIDTYGSSTRKMPGKKSQSIRFAPSAIRQLKSILAERFS